MRLNARLGAYDNQALDEIAQFPDISGPGIANKNFRGGVAELAHFLSICGAEFSQEKSRQRGDVFLAVAQSRHVKGDHVQPVEKILAKGAARYLLFEMLVCRGDDAVKLPLMWPKSSDSISSSGIAAQLTSTKGPLLRRLAACNARATSSLPVPLSP